MQKVVVNRNCYCMHSWSIGCTNTAGHGSKVSSPWWWISPVGCTDLRHDTCSHLALPLWLSSFNAGLCSPFNAIRIVKSSSAHAGRLGREARTLFLEGLAAEGAHRLSAEACRANTRLTCTWQLPVPIDVAYCVADYCLADLPIIMPTFK